MTSSDKAPPMAELPVTKLTHESLTNWLRQAQRGAMLCYASGFTPAQTEAMRDEMHRMVAQGFMNMKQVRSAASGFRYLIERTSRPWGQPIKVIR